LCCIVGEHHDGHRFASDALDRGAACLVVERELPLDVAQIVVADSRRATGVVAAAFHGWPSEQLQVVGVTGTNGKTTTSHLLAAILDGCGRSTAVLGTLSGPRTTPEATDLQRLMAGYVHAGKRAVVMEVTSHALALDRVVGTRFAVSVFTNLSKDHLDFHGTEERYFAAKARLFTSEFTAHGVVNRDDVHGRLLLDSAPVPCSSFGMSDIKALLVTPRGHAYDWRGRRVSVALGGRVNVLNSLGAATAASALGVGEDDIVSGLSSASPVPGRFELIEGENGVLVIVDYAHDAASLSRVLESARESMPTEARLTVVFGCGGERDALKRPAMGSVAVALADHVVLTDDNPRNEDPATIIDDIVAGITDAARSGVVSIEHDRRSAIDMAIKRSRAGDVVVVAGKGHEATQTIGNTVVPFNDAQVVRELVGAAS
jgi:UDP-N-acetylmuramoyl-L-alanyl-D-glutamate--2,6-diaminopimelate ligase